MPAARPDTPRRIIFLLVPEVHVLDLAGPLQTLFEANGFGARFQLVFASTHRSIRTAQGLLLSELELLPDVDPNDLILVPGMSSDTLDNLSFVPVGWLKDAYAAGARLGSVCSGAFALAKAGLLDGIECTTHWKLTDRMTREFPKARVLRNRLFVRSDRIITSAGVSSGIDMALALVEEAQGPLVAAQVAREMVVYLRRNEESAQDSIYLDYRTHLNASVHRVQDWLVTHPDTNPNLETLAGIARMSPRHLTRVFREATGVTLKTFITRLKLEIAAQLLHDPKETVESVAFQCGYSDPRQLRRIFKKHYGESPSDWKRQRAEQSASRAS